MGEFKRIPVTEEDLHRAAQEVDSRIQAARAGIDPSDIDTKIVMPPHVVIGVALSEALGQNIFTGETIPRAETSTTEEQ